jgi:hypothetical protein
MSSMNWYNIYLGFIFLCNLCFLVGAGFMLYRILDSMNDTRTQLLKAARENTQAGHELLTAAHRSIREMERASEAQLSREISNQRAITELSNQVQNLVASLRRLSEKPKAVAAPAAATNADGSPAAATGAPAEALPPANAADAQREKLRAELTAALARNHQLRDEISQTVYQLKDVSQANQALLLELRDLKTDKKAQSDRLLQRATELEAQLQAACDRAKAAELLAEANAFKLENLRDDAAQFAFSDSNANEVDQSGLIDSQQAQIDMLAAREKALLERIEAVEQKFTRTQVEKEFIEERFLKMDQAGATEPPANPAPAA